MRYVALVVVALLAAAVFVVPEPTEPVADAPPAASGAPFAVCPLGESARRSTRVVVAGSGAGTAEASVFSAGEIVASDTVDIGADGVGLVEVDDLTGLALAPVLMALPEAAPVGSVMEGEGRSASGCGPGASETVVLPGGVTTEGEAFEIRLANPFAGSASVSLLAASEVGTESDPSLDEVVVPPRGVVTVDLAELLRGRLGMSVAVTTTEGRVVASAVQAGGGDTATWQAVVPALDWYVPVPRPAEVETSLVLAAPGPAEVAYQLDVYGPDGVEEAAVEGVVPARGHLVVPTSDLPDGTRAVRVVAAAPVGATLRLQGEGVRAVMPGVTAPQPGWVLPGAGLLGDTRVLVFNPSTADVTAQISSADGSETMETRSFPAGSLTGVTVPAGTTGLRIDADGDLAVSWFSRGANGIAADAAQPAISVVAPGEIPPATTAPSSTTTAPQTTTPTTSPSATTTSPTTATTAPGAPSTSSPDTTAP